MRKRVVITGIGAISPIGNSAAELCDNAFDGVCGIAPMTLVDTTDRKVKVAAEVKDFDPLTVFTKMEARRTARFSQFAVAAAVEAFEQCGIDMEQEDASRCGVSISSGIGGLKTIETEYEKGKRRGFDSISPLFIPMIIANMASGLTAIRLGFKGSANCIVTACASGTDAIGQAFRTLRDGYADVMAAGGTEASITDLGVGGFASMMAVSGSEDPQRASIPFDKERAGFVMGEGAGVVIMETYEHAKARGAKILGEIVGYGVGCDAHHMTAPLEDGSGAAKTMEDAIADAGIAPEDVKYINAHGTGTPMNDRCETAAVKSTFGEHAKDLVISSTKSMIGHTLGASGALEAIVTMEALSRQMAPPTIGYKVPDPDCDLDVCPNEAKKIETEYAMSNSFGFGGHNGSLIFRRVSE